MGKRGLVIIYDPHALMQFLQFYCMGDYVAVWDALCLPKEDGKEEMHSHCERTGVFQNIYTGESEYKSLSVSAKFKLFIPMVWFSITGRRKKYCRQTLNQYVGNVDKYDILAANIDTGFISGMLASFGREKEVIYFEDGIGDYSIYRKHWRPYCSAGFFEDLQCVVMARLGYFGKCFTYLKPTKDTIKYCSIREELRYRNYKEIRQFQLNPNMLLKFRGVLNQTYPELSNLMIDEKTAIAFTEPIEPDCDEAKEYADRFVRVICQKHTRVLLKCHPRENVDKYLFPENIAVEVVPKDIPAELLFPYINGNACYFMFANSVLLGVGPYNLDVNIVYLKDINNEGYQKYQNIVDYDGIKALCDRFIKNQYNMIGM
ncbi:MAG: alpha-2,8-polysialyltransferase family protein [Clostridium sp.]|nr:alpha-2,8-polysialyltransferase family protein [Clostridium sp.]